LTKTNIFDQIYTSFLFHKLGVPIMALTKADLINQVHPSNHKLRKVQAREAVETILKIMKANLGSGDDVLLSGFGKFDAKAKSARKWRNPQTDEAVMLEARKVVTFKPSRILREKVNGK
jgi:integration host factor subunit alpha